MWTNENRARYDRSKLRYPSDLADTEWAIIAPLIPPAKRGGNKRTVVEREIVNGLMGTSKNSCFWAAKCDFEVRGASCGFLREFCPGVEAGLLWQRGAFGGDRRPRRRGAAPPSRYAGVAVRSRKANRLMLYTRFIRPIFALALTKPIVHTILPPMLVC